MCARYSRVARTSHFSDVNVKPTKFQIMNVVSEEHPASNGHCTAQCLLMTLSQPSTVYVVSATPCTTSVCCSLPVVCHTAFVVSCLSSSDFSSDWIRLILSSNSAFHMLIMSWVMARKKNRVQRVQTLIQNHWLNDDFPFVHVVLQRAVRRLVDLIEPSMTISFHFISWNQFRFRSNTSTTRMYVNRKQTSKTMK